LVVPLDPHALHTYTDGSCYRNPGGQSGAAARVVYPEHLNLPDEQILDFGCGESTNNRMELLACIRALQWIRQTGPWAGVTRVQIITDSRYLIDNLPRAQGWKTNKWRNFEGEPKENSDLWNDLLSARAKAGIRVDFEWRKGKTNEELRTIDKAAKDAAKRGGLKSDAGFKGGKVARSKVRGAAMRFPAGGQTAVIRVYRKNAPSKADNKIRFDLLDEVKREYTKSYYAYTNDLLALDLSRQGLFRVRFNNTPRYPQILEIIETMLLGRATPRTDN
jgi:ribonuclease HI